MNYFTHARRFLDDPCFVAGTALPDWLRVIDKRTRVRAKTVQRFLDQNHDQCSRSTLAVCRGIIQHHSDDNWFHNSPTFLALNLQFTRELRDLMRDDGSMRAGFVGHIAIELLLDATLIECEPKRLADYYRTLDGLDGEFIQSIVEQIVGHPVDRLAKLIRRFSIERFLYDYLEDRRLLKRINQVMARVGLAALPDSMLDWLPLAREQVVSHRDSLTEEENFDEVRQPPPLSIYCSR